MNHEIHLPLAPAPFVFCVRNFRLQRKHAFESLFNNGYDIKQFVDQYIDFILELVKYNLMHTETSTKLFSMKNELDDTLISIQNPGVFLNNMLDELVALKTLIKYESDAKSLAEVMLTKLAR